MQVLEDVVTQIEDSCYFELLLQTAAYIEASFSPFYVTLIHDEPAKYAKS